MNKKEREFVEIVFSYYEKHNRNHLPWRKTKDPYKILVSELMLQQTQVDRVIPKYKAFVKRWPNAKRLASASLGDVLKEWQGLGYNRRAKFLHECAKTIIAEYNGVFPDAYEELQKLPGIGPYTAGAVTVFAHNKPIVLIETNVRTVFLYHFFKNKNDVSDIEILKLVEKTLPNNKSGEWYAALMDYGSHLKKTIGNINQKSKHYTKQSKFSGSDRQIRGAIIKLLSNVEKITLKKMVTELSSYEDVRILKQIDRLLEDGLVIKEGRSLRLP